MSIIKIKAATVKQMYEELDKMFAEGKLTESPITAVLDYDEVEGKDEYDVEIKDNVIRETNSSVDTGKIDPVDSVNYEDQIPVLSTMLKNDKVVIGYAGGGVFNATLDGQVVCTIIPQDLESAPKIITELNSAIKYYISDKETAYLLPNGRARYFNGTREIKHKDLSRELNQEYDLFKLDKERVILKNSQEAVSVVTTLNVLVYIVGMIAKGVRLDKLFPLFSSSFMKMLIIVRDNVKNYIEGVGVGTAWSAVLSGLDKDTLNAVYDLCRNILKDFKVDTSETYKPQDNDRELINKIKFMNSTLDRVRHLNAEEKNPSLKADMKKQLGDIAKKAALDATGGIDYSKYITEKDADFKNAPVKSIKSEKDFETWAYWFLKNIHGEKYDKDIAKKTIDGIMKDHKGDPQKMFGVLKYGSRKRD